MNELQISINEILGEERIKEIAEEELRESISHHLSSERTLTNILTNITYASMQQFINDAYNEDLRKLTAERIEEWITTEKSLGYYIYSHDKAVGQQIVNEEVERLRPRIIKRIEECIDKYVVELDKEDIEEIIWESIVNKLLTPKEKKNEEA